MKQFLNKVVIITGGSRGIGFETAKAFLNKGSIVIITASNLENALKAKDKLCQIYPNGIIDCISPNLSNLEDVRKSFRSIYEKYGCIDVLINNAGISESTSLFDYTEELFEKVMNLNVKAVFNASKAASDIMIIKNKGVILNTSSIVSMDGQPSGVSYPTSKFAVNGLTISLARELGPKGIRVNAVAPGIIETDMMKSVPKKVIDPIINTIPLKRLGSPKDIANAFIFLASEEASYITGVVLRVDGAVRI